MTRDEILNMPDYKLFALIADKFDIVVVNRYDIANAWRVVEKIRLAIIPHPHNDGWIAKIDNEAIYADSETEEGALIGWPELHWLENIVVAETAPLAICRAALLAVMEDKDE